MPAEFDFPRPNKHLSTIEAWRLNPNILRNPEILDDSLRRFLKAANLNVVSGPLQHQFNPHGITSMAVLAESHAGLHTYEEQEGHIELQLSTCSAEGINLEIPIFFMKHLRDQNGFLLQYSATQT